MTAMTTKLPIDVAEPPDEHSECRKHLWAAGELLQRIAKDLDRGQHRLDKLRGEIGDSIQALLNFEPKGGA